MPGLVPNWLEVATSDRYRTASPQEQTQLKLLWLRDIAPQLHPEVMANPVTKMGLQRYVYQFRIPGKLPDEDSIITPDTLHLDGFSSMERSLAFKTKNRNQQQALRNIWFYRMSAADPGFTELTAEEQGTFYQKLMGRGPGLSSNLFWRYDIDEITEKVDQMTKAQKGAIMFAENWGTMFLESFGALIIGPARLLAGENSQIARALQDVEKHRDWMEAKTEESNQFFTTTLPRISGYATGIVLPAVLGISPFIGLEKALAGGFKAGVKVAAKTGKFVQMTPGLLEKAGRGIGLKAPSITYQVLGGAMAGAIQGVGEALYEGKPWHTYLARDMTIGVATEGIARYLGMVRALRQQARQVGIPGGRAMELLQQPFRLGEDALLPPELTKILQSHPDASKYLTAMSKVDPQGRLLARMTSMDGVRMEAEIMGYTVDEGPSSIRILSKPDGKELFSTDFWDANSRINAAVDWLDAQPYWDVYKKAMKAKKAAEVLAMSPEIEVRTGMYVPEEARREIIRLLRTNQVNPAWMDFKDPRASYAQIDEIYTAVKKLSKPKAATYLAARGIVFNTDRARNIAEIANLKGRLNEISPEAAYSVINQQTGNQVMLRDLPAVTFENEALQQPFMFEKTFHGNAHQIRQLLNTMRKQYANEARAVTKITKGTNIEMLKFIDTQTVEMKLKVPDIHGNPVEATIHFPSMKAAHQALVKGEVKGINGFRSRIFDKDKATRKAFEDWAKATRKTAPDVYRKDFLPFAFISHMASQNNYYLGWSKGKYLLQDMFEEGTQTRVREIHFDSLDEVSDFLRKHDGHRAAPDLLPEIKPEAVEDMDYVVEELDPMKTLEPMLLKRNQIYGLRRHIAAMTAPTQHVMRQFESLRVMDDLARKYNFSTVEIHNRIRDMTRMQNAFTSQRTKWLKRVRRGLNDKQADMIWRYNQALDDPAEAVFKDMEYELKSDIFREMTDKWGPAKANDMVASATDLMQYFRQMFSEQGMRAEMFVRHYMPHMASELKKMNAGLSMHIDDMRKLSQLPDTEKQFFFELMREADPKDVLWETNAFRLAEVYTHLMSRKMFARPMLTSIKDDVRVILTAMREKGMTHGDFLAVKDYIAQLFANIEGINAPADRLFQYATDNALQGIVDDINMKWGTNFKARGKHNAVSTAITWATGAHLAGRGYSVFVNSTQPFLITGSMVGHRWMWEGLEEALQPGSRRRMIDLGIIRPQQLPVAFGEMVPRKGVGRAVHLGMKGYTTMDEWNRTWSYLAQERKARYYIDLFRRKKITKQQFLRRSGALTYGKAEYNQAIKYLDTKGAKVDADGFVDHLSRLAVERTQWIYDSYEQPQLFRRGIGKIFGQYTSWPINFYNLVKDRMLTDSLTIPQKIEFMARLGGTTAAVGAGLWSIGVNPNKFAPWNMGTMQPGPYFQLLSDMLEAANGSRDAYAKVIRAMMTMVPFAYAGEGMMKAVQAYRDGDAWEALLHMMAAPVRYDRYPRRELPQDQIEQWFTQGGMKLFPETGRTHWDSIMERIGTSVQAGVQGR